ncbi:hypothetical protein [Undibacterium sp.]|nr:hypothetical protein [Undibacterium sp.]
MRFTGRHAWRSAWNMRSGLVGFEIAYGMIVGARYVLRFELEPRPDQRKA